MKKITKLTKNQEETLPEYVKKWVDNASAPLDIEAARSAIDHICRLDRKKTPEIIVAKGPLDAMDVLIKKYTGKDSNALSPGELKDAASYVKRGLYVSQWWGFWAGYYDYASFLGVEFDETKKGIFLDFCKNVPFLYAFTEVIVVCEKPKISWKRLPIDGIGKYRYILHNDTGPSVEYQDGFKIYSLNNITVPEWLVMTDTGKIDPRLALTEKNVDVQREIIRKVGAERMLKAAKAKTLDVFVEDRPGRGNVYRLMSLEVGNSIRRKYLYFESIALPGVFYAQPVHPSLERAIHARAYMLGHKPEELNGMSAEQDAELLASFPKLVG